MARSKWLTDDQQAAWRRFVAVAMLLPAALDTQLQRDEELTHFGYWVLAMLSEAPKRRLRMTELAARSNSSLSRLSHTVARLEAQGWVVREPSPDDRRGNFAVLTADGLAKVRRAAPGHVRTVQELVFDALTDSQVRQLDGISRALLMRLDPQNRLAASAAPAKRPARAARG